MDHRRACDSMSPGWHGRVFRCNRPFGHDGDEHKEIDGRTFATLAGWSGSTWTHEPPKPTVFGKKKGRKA